MPKAWSNEVGSGRNRFHRSDFRTLELRAHFGDRSFMVSKQPTPINLDSCLYRTSGFLAWSAVLTVIISAPDQTSTAQACAVVERPDGRVSVAEEHAIILWDAEAKTEHFIRRAQFRTRDADFGFLVPTP